MIGKFLRYLVLGAPLLVGNAAAIVQSEEHTEASPSSPNTRPNLLFAIADDWGYPHASAYAAPVIQTPVFDRVAREGILFTQAYISSPSCTPSRAAILTGQWHWRLRESANLHSTLDADIPVYTELLQAVGYHVGYSRKGWGPGRHKVGGREENPAGPRYKNFEAFMAAKPEGAPFCYWFGSYDPHRTYEAGSGAASGMKLDEIELYECFPNVEPVRGDVADYFFEVQRFDREVGEIVTQLERAHLLDETLVVITGDHGMPFPRCKSNLYDTGTRVPLAMRWPAKIEPERNTQAFVSLTDLAPTFLELAGVEIPAVMTGKSLMPLLAGESPGPREHVLVGKERHTPCQEAPDMGGYPCRGLRNRDFLYIHNFSPERWPSGTPHYERSTKPRAWLADCDNGPTKSYLFEHREEAQVAPLYAACFAKRPARELYDLRKDPAQLHNVAADSAYAEIVQTLHAQLMAELRASADPRLADGAETLESYPYYGGAPKWTGPTQPALDSPQAHDQRGDEHLLAGRFKLAIEDFDVFLQARPEFEPQHWRRGIAYYYAGRYKQGVLQFELHRSVNPNDVENATWHFLCNARLKGPAAARAALLPVGPDARAPMGMVLELFAGRATDEQVLAQAERAGSASARFYAHLYLGLHHEALGHAELAAKHLRLAATTHASRGYMGDVARMHAKLLRK